MELLKKCKQSWVDRHLKSPAPRALSLPLTSWSHTNAVQGTLSLIVHMPYISLLMSLIVIKCDVFPSPHYPVLLITQKTTLLCKKTTTLKCCIFMEQLKRKSSFWICCKNIFCRFWVFLGGGGLSCFLFSSLNTELLKWRSEICLILQDT